ncbi:hypothetical protein EJB05_09579, partial [Eragrostis curvula]
MASSATFLVLATLLPLLSWQADDFFLAANLDKPRDTTINNVGSNVTLINAMRIPGLNNIGISLAHITILH